MAIRASSSKHIDALIADLAGSNEVAREAAVARLTVIGARAVDRLTVLADTHRDAAVRTGAFRALEGIGDERALGAALRHAADADASTAIAAMAVARLFLKSVRGAEVVDRLTATALDEKNAFALRAAAVTALRDLDPKTIAPLLKALPEELRGSRGSRGSGGSRGFEGTESTEGVRDWLSREGGKAPLSSLLGIVERAREREAAEPASTRAAWAAVRFDAHMVLARRRSRIALYDLRESLERATTPLPVNALAALTLAGDASCLEPIAAAYARSKDKWWRDHLLEAFHTIVKREKLTPRHAVMKRIAKKFGF